MSILIAINPGAKKLIKGEPKTSPLLLPSAKDKTDKNNKLDTSGDRRVCCQTVINLLHSLSHKLLKPIQLIYPNLLTPILYFFHSFSEFGWVIAWLILIVFMIGFQPLFVHIIAPMFNKFTPLDDGELRSEIEKYSSKVDFPLSRIDVMDGSKRSAHSNAYFTGFGKSRRIAIFDTLIDKHSTKEIVSVVAHEVGHYKLKHIFQGIILGIIETGIMLFCLVDCTLLFL